LEPTSTQSKDTNCCLHNFICDRQTSTSSAVSWLATQFLR